MDEEVIVEGSQEKVGTIRGCAGGYGLAFLRLRPGLQAEGGGAGQPAAVLRARACGARLRTWRPQWWPEVWGREEEGGEDA